MTEIDKPKPVLTLIDGDRAECERQLVYVLCCGSLEEFCKAVEKFTVRASLRSVEATTDGTKEHEPGNSP